MTERLILFVCTGNTCRSPMAEHLMRRWLGPRSRWTTASAGVAALPDLPASPEAIAVCRDRGIDLAPHRSRRVSRELVDRARLIVVMTRMHRDYILSMYPQTGSKVALLTSFGGDSSRLAADIEDPMGCGESVYRKVCDTIDAALPDLAIYLHEHFEGQGRRKSSQ